MIISKETIDQILIDNQIETTVLNIYLAGSRVLGVSAPGDYDYVIHCSNLQGDVKTIRLDEDGIHYDLFLYDINFYRSMLRFETGVFKEFWNVLTLYYVPIYETEPVVFDIMSVKDKYLACIKDVLEKTTFNRVVKINHPNYKKVVVPYIVTTIYDTLDTSLTEEMKTNIQSLYDETNTSVLYEMKHRFELFEVDA